ncbi:MULTISPECIES: hypothetical protein [Aeromonas]|uniref:hypothetical protein n=1 Tax=Aeromonas TaxID=642 RepID=UPI000F7A8C83|nr:hypothetical protein [Aeromonas salmonicida]RSM32274.1 hypothetical protein C5B78_00910 [Aeromonas salmonicida]
MELRERMHKEDVQRIFDSAQRKINKALQHLPNSVIDLAEYYKAIKIEVIRQRQGTVVDHILHGGRGSVVHLRNLVTAHAYDDPDFVDPSIATDEALQLATEYYRASVVDFASTLSEVEQFEFQMLTGESL